MYFLDFGLYIVCHCLLYFNLSLSLSIYFHSFISFTDTFSLGRLNGRVGQFPENYVEEI